MPQDVALGYGYLTLGTWYLHGDTFTWLQRHRSYLPQYCAAHDDWRGDTVLCWTNQGSQEGLQNIHNVEIRQTVFTLRSEQSQFLCHMGRPPTGLRGDTPCPH